MLIAGSVQDVQDVMDVLVAADHGNICSINVRRDDYISSYIYLKINFIVNKYN